MVKYNFQNVILDRIFTREKDFFSIIIGIKIRKYAK